ncbi:MAG: bifunctional demethylmenaquinone methyltransferase/2-methoxy-6-polyprenyl-1,4-benzoquinol methylase UbiE [Myxococcota bacterium]
METDSIRLGSGAMFDRIARRYDLLNRVISLGLDQRWRRRLVSAVLPGSAEKLLDLATGTADVAIAAAKLRPEVTVVGVDPSAAMIEEGQHKLRAQQLQGRVSLELGNAEALHFPNASFDGVSIAFGIRNVPDRKRALMEMARVTKPGGVVGILELGEPKAGPLAALARVHIHRIVPALGAFLSGDSEYRYLARSIAAFPRPEAFCALMEEAGLVEVRAERLSFGAVYLYLGRAPTTPAAG